MNNINNISFIQNINQINDMHNIFDYINNNTELLFNYNIGNYFILKDIIKLIVNII